MKDDDLRQAFAPFGEVAEAIVVKNKQGKPRGFGFVQLDCKEHANRAMQALNANEIKGRPVAIDWALSKLKYLEHVHESEEVKIPSEEEKETAQDKQQKKGGKAAKAEEAGSGSDEDDSDGEQEEDEGEEPLEESRNEDGTEESAGNEKKAKADEDAEDADEEDEDGSPKEKSKKPPPAPDVGKGATIFVRNLLFSTTGEEVREKCVLFYFRPSVAVMLTAAMQI